MRDALESGSIRLTIQNTGRGTAWHLVPEVSVTGRGAKRHITLGELPDAIRKLAPRKSTTLGLPISADGDLPRGKVSVVFKISEGNGFDPPPLRLTFKTQEFLEPELVVKASGIDDRPGEFRQGDGDYIIENMERVEVAVVIENRGPGRAKATRAVITSADPNVTYFGDENFRLGDLRTGETKAFSFAIMVNNRYGGGSTLPIFIEIDEHFQRYGLSRQNLGLEFRRAARSIQEIDVPGVWREDGPRRDVDPVAVDVDIDIPRGRNQNPDAVAVVIGNRNYQNVPDVDYAGRDAIVCNNYFVRTFGISSHNVITRTDATIGDLRSIFGTPDAPDGQLANYVTRGASDVYVYYSGHGASSAEGHGRSGSSYLVPVDWRQEYAQTYGYPLDLLYTNLGKLGARSVTVFVDACFSGRYDGGDLQSGISPVSVEHIDPFASIPGGAVFASAQGDEVSCWYDEKVHGLFTYFLLRGFRGEADRNRDRRVTIGELDDFLSEKIPYHARRLKNKDQHPYIRGDPKRVLLRLR